MISSLRALLAVFFPSMKSEENGLPTTAPKDPYYVKITHEPGDPSYTYTAALYDDRIGSSYTQKLDYKFSNSRVELEVWAEQVLPRARSGHYTAEKPRIIR